MVEVLKTSVFDAWVSDLKDRQAVARITARGPGYRVYYQQRGSVSVLLLCGGDKRTQDADIRRAIELARYVQEPGKGRSATQPKARKKR